MPQQKDNIAPEYNFLETLSGFLWNFARPLQMVYNILSKADTGFFRLALLEAATDITTQVIGLIPKLSPSKKLTSQQEIENQKSQLKKLQTANKFIHTIADMTRFYIAPEATAYERGFRRLHDFAFWIFTQCVRPKTTWGFEFTAILEIIKNLKTTKLLHKLENELWNFDNETSMAQLRNNVKNAEEQLESTKNSIESLKSLIKQLQNININVLASQIPQLTNALNEFISKQLPSYSRSWELEYDDTMNSDLQKQLLSGDEVVFKHTSGTRHSIFLPSSFRYIDESLQKNPAWISYINNVNTIREARENLKTKIQMLKDARTQLFVAINGLFAFISRDIHHTTTGSLELENLIDCTNVLMDTFGVLIFLGSPNISSYKNFLKKNFTEIMIFSAGGLIITKVLDLLYKKMQPEQELSCNNNNNDNPPPAPAPIAIPRLPLATMPEPARNPTTIATINNVGTPTQATIAITSDYSDCNNNNAALPTESRAKGRKDSAVSAANFWKEQRRATKRQQPALSEAEKHILLDLKMQVEDAHRTASCSKNIIFFEEQVAGLSKISKILAKINSHDNMTNGLNEIAKILRDLGTANEPHPILAIVTEYQQNMSMVCPAFNEHASL